MMDLQRRIKDRFQASQRILITSHIRPDGDAIGSSLALALALLDAGKQVQVVLSDGIPASFEHLPGANLVETKTEGDFDLIVCVDCSEIKRIGTALPTNQAPVIVIDHHLTATEFGNINLIEPEAAATASLLTRYLSAWGLVITPPIAANLMTGLLTDTIGFRTSNTTPEVLRQAATLMEVGVDMSTIYFESLIRRTIQEAKYWGVGLSHLQCTDGILWTSLALEDRKTSGYTGNDDADLINILSSINEADIAWRGLKADVDVSQIARQFNGGGHKAAAGAELSGSLEEVQQSVLTASYNALQHSEHKR
jgi:phosphoesterase RecJ-like protein